MDKFAILQHVPFYEYEGSEYKDIKELNFEGFNGFYRNGCSVLQCVNGYYYHHIDYDMDKNGMEKFVAMLCGMLFEMQHNEVDEDLALIKADIKTIKEYLKTQPELMEEVKEKRKKAQSE